MGGWEIRSLETRLGRECSISKGETRFHSGGIRVEGVRGGSHSVTAEGEAPRVRVAKSSEIG